MRKRQNYILTALMITGIAVQVFFATQAFAAYVSFGTVTSVNLLSGSSASSITNFHYNISSLPGNSSVTVQFSTDNSTWYSSAGVLNGSDTLSTTGGADLSLSGLGWSGSAFYYKLKINSTSDLSGTPAVEDVQIDYVSSSGYGDVFAVNTTGNTAVGNVEGISSSAGSRLSVAGGGVFGSDYFTNVAPTNGVLVEGMAGFGTTSPWGLLSVAGLSSNTAPLFAISTSTASATSTAFVVDSNGNVGIGTSSPSSQLAVSGGWFATASSTSMNGINITNGCYSMSGNCLSLSSFAGILAATNGGTGWGNVQANTILLGNGTNKFATTSAGTDGQVLALYNGVPTWQATTTAGTGLSYSAGAFNLNLANANTWTALQQFNRSASSTLLSANQAWFGGTGTTTITNAGWVGIGSSSPTYALSVEGTSTAWANIAGYFVGTTTATSTLTGGLSTNLLKVTSTIASSTFANGIILTGGCVSLNSTSCMTQNAGTVTSVDVAGGTTGLTFSGGAVTTSGTITMAGTLGIANGGTNNTSLGANMPLWYNSASGKVEATSSQLTVGNLLATSTTANSQFWGNVGISTSTPWAQFAINPIAGQASNQFVVGSSTATNFLINNSGYAGLGTTSPYATLSVNTSAGVDPFAVGSSTGNYLRVNQFGEIAIGTTTAGCLNTSAGGVIYSATCATGGASFGQAFEIGGNSMTGFLAATTTQKLWLGQATSTMLSANQAWFGGTATSTFTTAGWLGVGSSTPWAMLSINPDALGSGVPEFSVGSSTATHFLVDGAGNVGIGSTSLAYKLSVDAGVTTMNDLVYAKGSINDFLEYNIQNTSTGVGAQSGYAATADTGTLTTNFLYMGINNSNFYNPKTYNVGGALDVNLLGLGNDMYVANGTANKKLFFMTGGTATSTNIRMTIDGVGNVGIGTTSPSAVLSVSNYSAGASTEALFAVASSTGTGATSTPFMVDMYGNVSLGSTTPWAMLSINPNGITGPALSVGSTTATSFIVTNGGNVGIGTTSNSFSTALVVNSSNSSSQLRLAQNNTLYTDFQVAASTGDLTVSLNPAATAKNIFMTQPGGSTGANLWVCQGDACPTTNITTGVNNMNNTGGNVVTENSYFFGNGMRMSNDGASVTSVYDTKGTLIMQFDEVP